MKKILLLGDSIRMGYEKYVRLAFAGTAEVYAPADCGRFAAYTLRYLWSWKGETHCGGDVDFVHWNAGLWDALLLPDGETQTPLAEYGAYIDRICRDLQKLFPDAVRMFATSTAVCEPMYEGMTYRRRNADIRAYNETALRVLEKYGEPVNDLWALTENAPPPVHSDATHFNTAAGARLLAGQVIAKAEQALGVRARELDYEAIFAAPEKVIGI